jgi:hypothetical protein
MRNLVLSTLTFLSFFQAQASCIFSKAIEVKETNIGNVLSWNTTQELDNEQFIVEKSLNGLDFLTIGEIKAAGNSTTEQKYRFLDISTGENKVFYRIAYIDTKKNIAHTPTFLMSRAIENNFIISAMSSLTTDSKISVSIRAATDATFTYAVLDADKKELFHQKIELIKGANVIALNLSDVPNGDYTLRFSCKKEVEDVTFRKVDKGAMPNINYVVKE